MKYVFIKKKIESYDIGKSAWFACYKKDIEFSDNQKFKFPLLFSIRKDRNLEHHQKLWACANMVSKNNRTEEYQEYFLETSRAVLNFILLKLGYVKSYQIIDNKTIVELESLAFDNWDQQQFEKFYEPALDMMEKISGISRFYLEKEWREWHEGIE